MLGGVATIPERWEVYAGDDCGLYFTFKENGQPIDISGWEVSAVWRPSQGAQESAPLTVQIDDAEAGRLALWIYAEQTEHGLIRSGVFDIQVLAGGVLFTAVRGCVNVTGDITR